MAETRTYVLVHGAWHGGWCWRDVAALLRAQGHRVTTPTLTGLGERRHLMSRDITLDTFVADILNHIEAEELDDIILVGHSHAGIAISGVADRIPERIRHLVYLDAVILESGVTAFDMLPPEVRPRAGSWSRAKARASSCRCRLSAPSASRRRIRWQPGCSAG